jgi:hypothetical protein
MIKLVKFSCGCIGTEPNQSGESHLIEYCDVGRYNDDPYPALSELNTRCFNKTFVPLTLEEYIKITDELSELISDGHKFRKLRWLLKEK